MHAPCKVSAHELLKKKNPKEFDITQKMSQAKRPNLACSDVISGIGSFVSEEVARKSQAVSPSLSLKTLSLKTLSLKTSLWKGEEGEVYFFAPT